MIEETASTVAPNPAPPTRRASLRAEDLVDLTGRLKEVEVTDPEDQSSLGIVYIRPISAGQMIDFMKAHKKDEYSAGIKLIATAVVDENGELLFTEDQARAIPFRTFGALQDEVQKALGLDEKKDEAAAEGNPSPATEESGAASSIA